MLRRLVLVLPVLLGACTVGPDYVRPSAAAGAAWMEPQAPGGVDERWWQGFGDPQLTALIEQAASGSPDLRAAEARLAQARAGRDAARGGGRPQGGASGAYSRVEVSENGQLPIRRIPGFSRDLSLFDVGFDASWEVDLWGRSRRTIEAAGARVEAAEAGRRDTLIRLRAEIARTYFALRAAQARVESARADAVAVREAAGLVARRFEAGEASRLDHDRAEVLARAAAGVIPALEGDEREAAYTLARLLGQTPEAAAPALFVRRPLPMPPAALGVGLRSDVLRRRPDVIQAERTLAASRADIGVATADLFPRVYLSGAVGQQSRDLGDISLAGSTRFQAGPAFSWPILQRGSIRANIRAANARADAAGAAYEAAVFGALADSETALNRFARAGAIEHEAAAALDAAQGALALARQRYEAGEDDLTPVLAARSAVAEAERRLIDARLGRAASAVAVFKALGT